MSVTTSTPGNAAPGGQSNDRFLAGAQRYRRELLAHCYRMTGSVHDAEDLVQETYLKAWKSYGGFKGQSSERTWLYRIATNTCLTALDGSQRRALPSGLGGRNSDPTADIHDRPEMPWLEPLPEDLHSDPADPSVVVAERESVRLAFVAALQHLPARQRAVVVLREVLQWKAAEVAEAVGVSTPSVNSLLQRARAKLDEVAPHREDPVREPESAEAQDLLDRYIAAFESYDIDALADLFTADAVWEMPPFDGWYLGPADIVELSRVHCPAEGPGDLRFVRTTANGQPAAALYLRNPATGVFEALQVHVLRIGAAGVSHVAAFHGVPLFGKFGFAATLEPQGAGGLA